VNPTFPATSSFQKNWQASLGTDLFNPNALAVDDAKKLRVMYRTNRQIVLNNIIGLA
jgi:hypothetical protein